MRTILPAFILTCLFVLAPATAQEPGPAAVLQSDAAAAEKAEAFRALALRGGPEDVPVLEPLLLDEAVSHMARLALEPMPHPEAGAALRRALEKASGALSVGIINSLANRGDEVAVPAMAARLSDADARVARAAAEGLGKIATSEAVEALQIAAVGADAGNPVTEALHDGLLRCADALAARGKQARAAAIYDTLLAADHAAHIRAAAFRGAALLREPAEALPVLVVTLNADDPVLFRAALSAAREIGGGEEVTGLLANALSALPPERRIPLMDVLAARGGEAAAPALMAEATADAAPSEVRVAALAALTRVGHEPVIEVARGLLWSEDAALAKAARDTLSYFPGEAGDAVLLALLESEEARERLLAIELTGKGGLHAPAGLLIQVARDGADEETRAAALDALRNHASLPEMPALLDMLTAARSPREMSAAESALAALATRQQRTPDGASSVADAFCAAFGHAKGEPQLAMLRLLGKAGGAKPLDAVRAAAAGDDDALKDAALRELCAWPSRDALPDVMELATGGTAAPAVKVLAMRGAVRLLRPGGLDNTALLEHYARLMEQAETPGETKLVLSGLGQVSDARALDPVLRHFGDEAVRAEAVQAAIAIAKALGGSAREDETFFNGESLAGWRGNPDYWRFEDGAITGHSAVQVPKSEFLWSEVPAGDFYLVAEVKLVPDTANSGIQFRSEIIDEHGKARGYQADIGRDVWGRLYHEQGRGKVDWTDRAEAAVKPEEWNRYEVLAIGPAIWTAINGTLGIACLDLDGERSGLFGLQLHAGPPQTVRYRFEKLVHDPEAEIAGLGPEQLIPELAIPEPK